MQVLATKAGSSRAMAWPIDEGLLEAAVGCSAVLRSHAALPLCSADSTLARPDWNTNAGKPGTCRTAACDLARGNPLDSHHSQRVVGQGGACSRQRRCCASPRAVQSVAALSVTE